jgi:hypothetical protein
MQERVLALRRFLKPRNPVFPLPASNASNNPYRVLYLNSPLELILINIFDIVIDKSLTLWEYRYTIYE